MWMVGFSVLDIAAAAGGTPEVSVLLHRGTP